MCDFPIRRESGAGNRIPGDFFAFFLGRARKKVPPRHERAKKEQTPVGGRHTFKPTVKWQGLTLRLLGRAGRNFPQRRPGAAWHSIRPVRTLFPVGCVLGQRNVRLIVRVAVSPNRRSSREPSGLHEWPRRQEEAGTATHPRRRAATCGLAFAGSGHRINCTVLCEESALAGGPDASPREARNSRAARYGRSRAPDPNEK